MTRRPHPRSRQTAGCQKRSIALLLFLLAPLGSASTSAAAPPHELAAPKAILKAAFTNRYEVNLISTIELTLHGRRGQQRNRTIRAVTKVIDGRVSSIGRLVAPEYLRGMTVLTMEDGKNVQNAFVFMPSLERTRRITTSQRGDAFFGSDVTYEDIERQRTEAFDIQSIVQAEDSEEPTYVIEVRPRRRRNYARAVFTISRSDSAILKTRYYKRDTTKPYRVISADREQMVTLGGHTLPTHLRVQNLMRGTHTDVRLRDLRLADHVPDQLFSLRTLDQGRPIPGER
jgi:hypothetical protein